MENENLLSKTGVPFFAESAKTENASFPFKTAMAEANFMKNRMVGTKWTNYKEQSFARTTLFFGTFFLG